MYLNKEDESKLAHRVNNYLATLNLTTELSLHEYDKESILLAHSTTNELIKFWKYVNFLYRNKALDIYIDDSLERFDGFPSDLVTLFIEELFTGGMRNKATFYNLKLSSEANSQTLSYQDNGNGFADDVLDNFGKIQVSGKNGAGLGLLVLKELSAFYGIEFKIFKNSATLIRKF